MKKKNIVKNKEDFTRIINKKNGYVNKYFIINEEVNNDLIPKFGITFIKICVMLLIEINLNAK